MVNGQVDSATQVSSATLEVLQNASNCCWLNEIARCGNQVGRYGKIWANSNLMAGKIMKGEDVQGRIQQESLYKGSECGRINSKTQIIFDHE
jgi:hypothetical protein